MKVMQASAAISVTTIIMVTQRFQEENVNFVTVMATPIHGPQATVTPGLDSVSSVCMIQLETTVKCAHPTFMVTPY